VALLAEKDDNIAYDSCIYAKDTVSKYHHYAIESLNPGTRAMRN